MFVLFSLIVLACLYFALPKCLVLLAVMLSAKSFAIPVVVQKIQQIFVCASAFCLILASIFIRIWIADGLFARNTTEFVLLATPAKMCNEAAFSVFVRSRRGPWLCVRAHAGGMSPERALSGFSILSSKAVTRGPFSKHQGPCNPPSLGPSKHDGC